MFLGLLDLDLDSFINKQRNQRLLSDFLSLKAAGNVPTESNKQNQLEKKTFFCWHLGSHGRSGSETGSGSVNQVYRSKDQNPDPYQNVKDPEHCFCSCWV
jgi:hypothetical protein